MNKTVSVIIPVYNVSQYLPKCLDSVLSQSYKQLQVIVVDDGSSDGSGGICDIYAERDQRVCVIHQENAGASAAKNAGLRIATGEYLSFVDSDDFLEPDAYRYMVDHLESSHADVVQCAYRDLFVEETVDRINRREATAYSTKEYLLRYTTDWTSSLLWDKLYRRSLFDGIFFEEGHIVDDEFFTYQGIMKAEKIVYLPKIIYNYRKRKSSVTAKPEYREQTIMDKMDYLIQRRTHIGEGFPELKDSFDEQYLNMLLWMSTDPYVSAKCLLRIKELLRQYFAEPNHTRVGIRQRLNLLRVQICRVDGLLRHRGLPQTEKMSRYFD